METRIKRPYSEMIIIANRIKSLLEPDCYRIEIAGSLRRKKNMIGDIEIVCIPKPFGVGLFESGIAKTVNKWKKIKGEVDGKYTQRILPEGIKLDLFFVERRNWGFIYALRTGSADYSHKVLGGGWVKNGYKGKEGYLYRNGKQIAIYEEENLFMRIGVPYVAPELRN